MDWCWSNKGSEFNGVCFNLIMKDFQNDIYELIYFSSEETSWLNMGKIMGYIFVFFFLGFNYKDF